MKLFNFASMFTFTVLALGVQFGCSTAKVRIKPGADGVHRVTSTDYEKDGAEEAAVDAANDFCKDRGKTAAFISEDTKYFGEMDEETRNTIRNASRAAKAISGSTAGNASSRNRDTSSRIRDLEREKSRKEMDTYSHDNSRKAAAQKRISEIDQEIAQLEAKKADSGSTVGDIAGVAGSAGEAYTNNRDYKNDVKFKCI